MMKGIFIDREKLKGAIWGRRRQLADAMGIAPSTVSRKINGKHPLSFDDLNEMARFLGRDALEFIDVRELPETP